MLIIAFNLKMELCFYVISMCFMQAGKANYLHLREAEREDILQRRDLSLILIFAHCLAEVNHICIFRETEETSNGTQYLQTLAPALPL